MTRKMLTKVKLQALLTLGREMTGEENHLILITL